MPQYVGFLTMTAFCLDTYESSSQGPVPTGLFGKSPAYALGSMTVLYEDWHTRYGKSANGLSRVNSTVAVSTALVPPGERMPASAARAPEPLLGSTTRSMLATTSSASKGLPSLNVTPWRSLNVHTEASALPDQLSARLGLRPFWLSSAMRYSQICWTRTMPPWS